MLVIIEGPDGAGKTTLTRQIVSQVPDDRSVTIHHAQPPRYHALREYEDPLHGYSPTNEDVICDRWHLGEYVYPEILQRPTSFDPPARLHVELFFKKLGALVVHLDPPYDVIRRNIINRGVETELDRQATERFSETCELFRYAVLACGLPTYHITQRMHGENNVAEIIAHARRLERTATVLEPFTTYVGGQLIETLLVGDVRGTVRNPVHGLSPAFVPYPDTSGHFLMSALLEAVYPNVGVINANDTDDIVDALDVIDFTGPRQVVALGAKAHNRLNVLGIEHGVVPHPQFIRRFHHGGCRAYGRAIIDAAHSGGDMLSWRP